MFFIYNFIKVFFFRLLIRYLFQVWLCQTNHHTVENFHNKTAIILFTMEYVIQGDLIVSDVTSIVNVTCKKQNRFLLLNCTVSVFHCHTYHYCYIITDCYNITILSLIHIGLFYFLYSPQNLVKEFCSGTHFHMTSQNLKMLL